MPALNHADSEQCWLSTMPKGRVPVHECRRCMKSFSRVCNVPKLGTLKWRVRIRTVLYRIHSMLVRYNACSLRCWFHTMLVQYIAGSVHCQFSTLPGRYNAGLVKCQVVKMPVRYNVGSARCRFSTKLVGYNAGWVQCRLGTMPVGCNAGWVNAGTVQTWHGSMPVG